MPKSAVRVANRRVEYHLEAKAPQPCGRDRRRTRSNPVNSFCVFQLGIKLTSNCVICINYKATRKSEKECTIPCKHWNPNRSACKHKAFVDLTLQLQRHPQSMPSTTASWECCMLLLHAQETRRSINEKTSFWFKPRLIVVGDLGTHLPTSNYSFTSFIDIGYARFRETTPLNAFRAASGGRKFSRPGLSFFLSFWLF